MEYKKIATVDAWQIGVDNIPNWVADAMIDGKIRSISLMSNPPKQTYEIQTLEGVMTTYPGNYLCRGVDGEIWSVEREIFEKTYIKVEDE